MRSGDPERFDPGGPSPDIVAEDERTVEPTDERAETGGTSQTSETGDAIGEPDDAPADQRRTPDDAAETFLELDADLDVAPEPDHTAGPRRGLVVDAARVDADAVPSGYPLSATTDRAVELTVDFGDGTTTVYLAWPDDADSETSLTRLLDAMGVELADLYGEEVLVERVDGHDALVTPDERPRGSDRRAGVLGGLAVVAGFVALLAATTGSVGAAGLVWALVTFVWLPYATYSDAWYARTHSDWDGGPAFWATLAMLPFLNLATGAAYLWRRSRATFFADQPSVLASVTGKLRSWR